MIGLPDQQAAALTAKAAAEGLTLEAWLKKLAAEEAPPSGTRSAEEAVARTPALQQRVKPDPEGWTIRDYIDYGRR